MTALRSACRPGLLLAACLLALGTSRAAQPPVVSVLEITGLEVIQEVTVRGVMRLHVGDAFDPQRGPGQLQADIAAVAELGWFYFDPERREGASTVELVRDADGNYEIRYKLVENPIVERIDLRGGTLLPDDVLAENVAYLKIGWPLNTNLRDRVPRALRDLEALYRDRGRNVTCTLPGPGESPPWYEHTQSGGVIVHIKVTPVGGDEPRPQPADQPGTGTTTPGTDEPLIPDEQLRVATVEVQGLVSIPESLVRETVQTRVGQPFSLETLKADEDALRDLGWFYFEADREWLVGAGYPVRAPGIGTRAEHEEDLGEKAVSIYYDMVENPVIKEVRLLGTTLIPSQTLLGQLAYLQPGRVLNTSLDRLNQDRRRLEQAYQDEGFYAFAEFGVDQPFITPQPDGTVIVTVSIREMMVGTITFDWLEATPHTKERVFRAYMRTREGSPYNERVIGEDLREIRRLDILESITLSPDRLDVDPNDPSKLNLVFEVVEKRTGNIGAGGGISSRFGLVGFVEASENNLFGLAQRVAGRVEIGGRFDFTASYFYPLLDGSGSELSFRAYNTQDRTGASGIGAFSGQRQRFDQTRRGGEVQFSRPIVHGLRGSLLYRFQNVSTEQRGSHLPSLPAFPFQDLNSDTTSSLTVGLSHDTRDLPYDATTGGYESGTVEIAGLGGDNHYTKYRLEARHYWPMFGQTIEVNRLERPAWVLATRATYGWASGRLPFSQSFLIGGIDTLRGYEEDQFFGNRQFLLNLELRRQFNSNIGAVAFFDAGRAWREGEQMDFLDDLASAVGLGLRVNTPVGPLRFDVGFGGDGSQLHFGFGQQF